MSEHEFDCEEEGLDEYLFGEEGGETKVKGVPRQVIDDQLLVALDDKSKVAIVASEADLQMLVLAMRRQPAPWELWDKFQAAEQQRMLTGLMGLGRAAFDWS